VHRLRHDVSEQKHDLLGTRKIVYSPKQCHAVSREMSVMNLHLYQTTSALREAMSGIRRQGGKIAFVPTMGYLHDGHAALIRRAAVLAPHVIVSDFVNPLQFGPNEDFARYPRDIEHDKQTAKQAGATGLYFPQVDELTPPNLEITADPGRMARILCGKSRPGHFRGVLTIVAKLFNIVQPDFAVFGWKDAQQLILIRKMVEDFNFPIQIEGVETVREQDGLAMSSRNVYLSPEERAQASAIRQALVKARDAAINGDVPRGRMLEKLAAEAIAAGAPLGRIDYVRCVSISRLHPLSRFQPGDTMIAAAVYFNKARLIDNIRF